MKVATIHFLILFSYSYSLSLPTRLKCVDILCQKRISNARTLHHITVYFGDLKELKKSIMVNIRGKHVNSNNVLWLVEHDGLLGFVNFTLLKEIHFNSINELIEVDNPFYIAVSDETEDKKDNVEDKSSHVMKNNVMNLKKVIAEDETEGLDLIPDDVNKEFETISAIVGVKEDGNMLEQQSGVADGKEEQIKETDGKKITLPEEKRDINENEQNVAHARSKEEVHIIGNNQPISTERKEAEEEISQTVSEGSTENQQIMTEEGKGINEDQQIASKRKEEEEAIDIKEGEQTVSEVKMMEDKLVIEESQRIVTRMKEGNENQHIETEPNGSEVRENQHTIMGKKENEEKNEYHDTLAEDRTNNKKEDEPFSDSTEKHRKVQSPFLNLVLKIETLLHEPLKIFISKSGLDSLKFVSKFVHNYLSMSVESFVLLVSLFLTLTFVVYTPKIFGLNQNWKYEMEKQTQLFVELESKLRTIEDERGKLTAQNRKFEKLIEGNKDKVREIEEDAIRNRKKILADLEEMKRINEFKTEELSGELEMKSEQCKLLEVAVVEKERIIEDTKKERNKMESDFNNERSLMGDKMNDLREKLLEVDILKKTLSEMSNENKDLKEEIKNLSGKLRDAHDEFHRLNSCFENFKMFEELGEEERRLKVQECLESRDVRQRLREAESEVDNLKSKLHEAHELTKDLEERNKHAEKLRMEFEEQRSFAVKEHEAAETKLQVLMDYFQKKEIEMQKNLGHESIEKSLSNNLTEEYCNRVDNLSSENNALSKTIAQLKNEVKKSQKFAVQCKNDANTQIANSFLKISHLERELMQEKDESKKLRVRLSYYIGPNPPRNTVNDGVFSRQMGHSETGVAPPPPPIFPLSMLPQTNAHKTSFSGRNSANSNSKRSNNS